MFKELGEEELRELENIKMASAALRLKLGFTTIGVLTLSHIVIDLVMYGFYENYKLCAFNSMIFIISLFFLFKGLHFLFNLFKFR